MTHEVNPITSGHRVVLTYNVINDSRSAPLPAAANLEEDSDSKLRSVLRQWSANNVRTDYKFEEVDFLCHYLAHQYTERSLSLSRMVGEDLHWVRRAAHAAEQADCVVYLATFERKRVSDCGDGGSEFGSDYGSNPEFRVEDEIEDDWTLQKVVTLDGTHVAEDVPIDNREMIDKTALKIDDLDREKFSGWTGNEGTYTTLWYKRSVGGSTRLATSKVLAGIPGDDSHAKEELGPFRYVLH